MSHVVYEVYSPDREQTYYGFCEGEDLDDARSAFWARVRAADPGPCMIAGPGLEFEIRWDAPDAESAATHRNRLRASDPNAVSGPIGGGGELATMATARDAYAAGAFSYLECCALVDDEHSKAEVTDDLDSLVPAEFFEKYGIEPALSDNMQFGN